MIRKATILGAIAAAILAFTMPAFAQHEPDHATPAEHAAPAGHGGGEHEHGPKAINWTDFGNKEQPPFAAQILNFAILLGIFFYFGRKPVMEGLKARRDSVAKEIEEAQRMKKEADERARMYQAKLARLEEELATTKAALIEAGKGERDRIIRDAQEKAERLARDAKELLVQETNQMRQDLVRETVDIAMKAAEDVLREKITPADQQRLADEFLQSLVRAPATRSSS